MTNFEHLCKSVQVIQKHWLLHMITFFCKNAYSKWIFFRLEQLINVFFCLNLLEFDTNGRNDFDLTSISSSNESFISKCLRLLITLDVNQNSVNE